MYNDVQLQGLDNFKTVAKETKGNRCVVPMKNATNLLDCKEIKQNSVREAYTSRSLTNKIT